MAWSDPVQAAGAESPGAPTAPVTFTSACTLGNKIIAAVATTDGSATGLCTGVADSGSNAFTRLGTATLATSAGVDVTLWGLDVSAATALTITATLNGAGCYTAINTIEVPGLLAGNTTAMLDGTAGVNTGATNTVASGSYSSAAIDEFLICVFGDDYTGCAVTKPAALTLAGGSVTDGSFCNIGIAYGNSTDGAESQHWTVASGTEDAWGQILVAFQLAGATPAYFPFPQRNTVPVRRAANW